MAPARLCTLLTLSVLLLAGCDTGRASLDEEDDPVGGEIPTLDGTCTALIDGESFEARTVSARIDLEENERLDIGCDGGETDLLFRLQPDAVEPATIALGTLGNGAQLSIGDEVTVTVLGADGSPAGEIILTTYTREVVAGTFSFDLPSFDGEGAPILVRRGEFDIELP